MPEQLSHVDSHGNAAMVDVSSKPLTSRFAVAQGKVTMSQAALLQVLDNSNKKGDVLTVTKIAGIQGAKNTASLIPLCHPIGLSHVALEFDVDMSNRAIVIKGLCKTQSNTGVEMEALTAVSIAALTLFDMCKAVDPNMVVEDIRVVEKIGGKSGAGHD